MRTAATGTAGLARGSAEDGYASETGNGDGREEGRGCSGQHEVVSTSRGGVSTDSNIFCPPQKASALARAPTLRGRLDSDSEAHGVYANARGARGMDRPKLGRRHLLPQVSHQLVHRQSTYMDPGSTRDFDPSGTGCGARGGAGDCGRDDGTTEIVLGRRRSV